MAAAGAACAGAGCGCGGLRIARALQLCSRPLALEPGPRLGRAGRPADAPGRIKAPPRAACDGGARQPPMRRLTAPTPSPPRSLPPTDTVSPKPAYCANASIGTQFPPYQPQACLSYQNNEYCFSSQPAWSAYREPSFGHGTLDFINGAPEGAGPGLQLARAPLAAGAAQRGCGRRPGVRHKYFKQGTTCSAQAPSYPTDAHPPTCSPCRTLAIAATVAKWRWIKNQWPSTQVRRQAEPAPRLMSLSNALVLAAHRRLPTARCFLSRVWGEPRERHARSPRLGALRASCKQQGGAVLGAAYVSEASAPSAPPSTPAPSGGRQRHHHPGPQEGRLLIASRRRPPCSTRIPGHMGFGDLRQHCVAPAAAAPGSRVARPAAVSIYDTTQLHCGGCRGAGLAHGAAGGAIWLAPCNMGFSRGVRAARPPAHWG